MTLVTNVAFILWRFGLSRLVAINFNKICHLASDYHCFLQLAAWATWLSGRMTSPHCTMQTQGVDWWCSMHRTMYVYTSFYTLWKKIEAFNEYYLIFYWIMLLLLQWLIWCCCSTRLTERIDDCCIRQRCCCCSWQLTKGSYGLLLWPGTINMISHHGSSVTRWWKTKPLDGTVTTLASISLASAYPTPHKQ